jgi:hypothetical protein
MAQETINTTFGVVTHKFINPDGTDFLVVKAIDTRYHNLVEQMNMISAHKGAMANVEWRIIAKGAPNWEMDEIYALSELVIVKEQITRKNRFGKKIKMRNQECAIYDAITAIYAEKDYDKLLKFAGALIKINPETKTFFQFIPTTK